MTLFHVFLRYAESSIHRIRDNIGLQKEPKHYKGTRGKSYYILYKRLDYMFNPSQVIVDLNVNADKLISLKTHFLRTFFWYKMIFSFVTTDKSSMSSMHHGVYIC